MTGAKQLLALFALAASANAQISESKIAEVPGLSFRIAIPETQAAPFDVYLSIVAPVTSGWASIAWGGKMIGNPLTIGWASGTTAVVSSRWAKSRTAPAAYAGASYTVLPSSVTNSTHWQLDVLCSGCSQWEGGKLDPSGVATFAWAKNTKAPSNAALNTSTISYHDSHGSFTHDLSKAKLSQSAFDTLVGRAAAPAATGGIQTSVVTLPVSSSIPVTSNIPVTSSIPVTSLSTTNGLPLVSLTTTNGIPIVSLTTTNGLPIVTLSTAPFPGIGEATTKDNVVVVATTVPATTRVRATPSFSLISPSKSTLIITTRVTTLWTSTRRVATPTKKASVVTVTVTRRPAVVVVEPTLVRVPPFRVGRPPVRGRPGRGPWAEDEE